MRFNVYDPAFLTRLKILQTRRQNQVQHLRRLETDEGAGVLFIQNSLGQIRSAQLCHHTLLSLRQLVYGKGTLIERLKRFSRSINLPEIAGLEPFFWLNPKRYPPPSDELIQLIEDTAVETFVKKARQLLLDSKLEDFLELQAAVMKGGGEDIKWLIEQINSVRVTHVSEVEVLAELFRELDEISKREVLSKLRCHPYVKAVLVRKIVRPVVLDGSNIARLRGKLGDIDFVLERLAGFEEFYYPYYLVFDRNIRYILNEDSEWFSAERTYFHSPADELVLSIALEKNAVVVSNDRFEEWNSKVDRIDLGRFFK